MLKEHYNFRPAPKDISIFSLLCLSLTITWFVSVNQTGGITNLRYANKDHLGREKSDLTTGRKELFEEEIQGFISNPFFFRSRVSALY
mgnify:CR=1 FL=1